MRILIQEDFLDADLCGSGSATLDGTTGAGHRDKAIPRHNKEERSGILVKIPRTMDAGSVSDPYSFESGSNQKSLSGSGSRRP